MPSRYLAVSRPWASGENAMHPAPFPLQRVQQAVLDPPVEDRVGRLVDQQWRAHLAQQRRRLLGARGGVGGNPRVQRPARADRGGQRAHGLLERGVRVGAVAVEDVHIVQAHPGERLVQAGQQVLARAPLAVGAGPHVVSGLGRDDQLIAVRAQVLAQDAAEVDLGRPVRRTVVVGEIEVGHAQVERAAQDRPLGVQRADRRRSSATARGRPRAASGRCARSGGSACRHTCHRPRYRSWRQSLTGPDRPAARCPAGGRCRTGRAGRMGTPGCGPGPTDAGRAMEHA